LKYDFSFSGIVVNFDMASKVITLQVLIIWYQSNALKSSVINLLFFVFSFNFL